MIYYAIRNKETKEWWNNRSRHNIPALYRKFNQAEGRRKKYETKRKQNEDKTYSWVDAKNLEIIAVELVPTGIQT
jgi:hypothetical protein